jgi:hypothetical protein
MTEGTDTGTLRVIGFANSNRILLFHKFIIVARPRVFPNFNPSKNANITLGNLALERGEQYSRRNFVKAAVIGYVENGQFSKENILIDMALSLVNPKESKHYYNRTGKLTDDIIRDIRKAQDGTILYIRLNIKKGKKTKSVWTRFTLMG